MKSFGPISPQYMQLMNGLAQMLDEAFNGKVKAADRSTGFALLVFPFGLTHTDKDRVNYISNAEREDMLVAMKEFIARAEGRHHEAEMKQ